MKAPEKMTLGTKVAEMIVEALEPYEGRLLTSQHVAIMQSIVEATLEQAAQRDLLPCPVWCSVTYDEEGTMFLSFHKVRGDVRSTSTDSW